MRQLNVLPFQKAVLTVCPVLILHVQLAQTKVAKCNVTGVVEENVFWLQITVNDVEAVQTLESAEKLGRVKAGAIDVESLLLLQVMEEFATVDKRKDQVELFRRLKGEFQRHDEGIVDLRQDRAFRQSMSDF